MGPALFGSSVSQVNILVSGIIASLIGTGKISLLYYSDRIMELPLSLFGVAIATVTLPYLSRLYSKNLIDKFSDAIYWSIKIALIFIIPASVGIFILAEPIIAVIYFGGAFDQIDVRLTSLSLSIFSIGLIGFSFVKILSPAYFAREDTKTPVKIGIICVAINLILGSGFVFYLQKINFEATHVGLASSISIAALMNAGLLFLGLKRNKILNNFKTSKIFFIKLCLANIVMLAFLVYTKQSLIWWLAMHAMERAIWLLMIILASMFLYFVTLSILGIKIKELKFERE
jgi:putative peptidoglycan lipid II flippase